MKLFIAAGWREGMNISIRTLLIPHRTASNYTYYIYYTRLYLLPLLNQTTPNYATAPNYTYYTRLQRISVSFFVDNVRRTVVYKRDDPTHAHN